jgi:hypothetical protein
MGDPLLDLARSTQASYRRFDVTPQVGPAARNLPEETDPSLS